MEEFRLSILSISSLIWVIITGISCGVLTVALGLHKKPTNGYGTGVIGAIAFILGITSVHFPFF
jgi:hypothetical protein